MKITRQADYAARAVLHLAQAGNNERVSTSHVANTKHPVIVSSEDHFATFESRNSTDFAWSARRHSVSS
jgi:DNA-binding IscR family transcriptional regulator